jgi:hypothetical protein
VPTIHQITRVVLCPLTSISSFIYTNGADRRLPNLTFGCRIRSFICRKYPDGFYWLFLLKFGASRSVTVIYRYRSLALWS